MISKGSESCQRRRGLHGSSCTNYAKTYPKRDSVQSHSLKGPDNLIHTRPPKQTSKTISNELISAISITQLNNSTTTQQEDSCPSPIIPTWSHIASKLQKEKKTSLLPYRQKISLQAGYIFITPTFQC